MSGGIKIVLGTPIKVYGDEVTELTLREPTGKDIRDCGYPFRFHAESDEVAPQAIIIARYISKLANIPMGSVDALTAVDFNECVGEILSFFGESPGASEKKEAPKVASKTSPATSPPCSADTPATS